MEENKTKKTGGSGLILAVLLISAIVIALMWVIIWNLNNEKTELQKQIDSSKSETENLKRQVLVLRAQDLNETKDNKVSNKLENEIDDEDSNVVKNEIEDEDSNVVKNEIKDEDSNVVDTDNTTNEVQNLPL